MKSEPTVEHLRIIQYANHPSELVVVAVELIRALERPVFTVCGPISTGGDVSANLERFKKAIRIFSFYLPIFDQIIFEEFFQSYAKVFKKKFGNKYPKPILFDFYAKVWVYGNINGCLFLPGWRRSIGARWEYIKAKSLGIFVHQLSEDFEHYVCRELLLIQEGYIAHMKKKGGVLNG